MSILRPTLGELLDRYSIEELKARGSVQAAEITGEIIKMVSMLHVDITFCAVDLALTNARIWQLREDAEAGAGVTLLEADRVNAERRRLVQAIDNTWKGTGK